MEGICQSPPSKLMHTGADLLLTAGFRGGFDSKGRGLDRLKLELYGDRRIRSNPFHWEKVIFNLPGSKGYRADLPWVLLHHGVALRDQDRRVGQVKKV